MSQQREKAQPPSRRVKKDPSKILAGRERALGLSRRDVGMRTRGEAKSIWVSSGAGIGGDGSSAVASEAGNATVAAGRASVEPCGGVAGFARNRNDVPHFGQVSVVTAVMLMRSKTCVQFGLGQGKVAAIERVSEMSIRCGACRASRSLLFVSRRLIRLGFVS